MVFSSTGTPASLPGVPVDEKTITTSTGALDLKEIPKTMIVIGAGVIGLEMGSVWRRLGTEVTVVEFLDHITPGIDSEIATTFHRVLKKQGMKFKMSTKVMGAALNPAGGATLTVEPVKGGDAVTMDADIVLLATGRVPFTQGLGLENVGIKVGARGMVEVDDHFATNVPGIFAIGDVVRGAMLAHKAEEEGIAIIEQIAGLGGHVNYDAIPNVIYTFPEVATVGKTEEELKEAGVSYNVGKFPFMANSRARANANTDGMVKILADDVTDKVLGIHIVSSNAGEMIA